MLDVITTTKNKAYKYIKSLRLKKTRTEEKRFTVEGIKSVRDAVASGKSVHMIAVSESFYKDVSFEYPDGVKLLIFDDRIFDGLCDTQTPQGITAVLDMFDENFKADLNRLYVYCDNIQDPGNLGTIIRTADAAGFGGVLLSKGCVDLYSPKTVRSSMGSFFNIDVIREFEKQDLLNLRDMGFTLLSGALREDSKLYTDKDFTKPSVIIIGNEANGVSDEILDISEHIIIPIYGKAESLNAAAAAAIIMYESVRQRRKSV